MCPADCGQSFEHRQSVEGYLTPPPTALLPHEMVSEANLAKVVPSDIMYQLLDNSYIVHQ